MKFIHTADLHLGASMRAHLDPSAAEKRRGELLHVFGRIAEKARCEGAAVLIAGDLFDTDTPGKQTRDYVMDTVASLPDVAFLCLSGNHDAGFFSAAAERPRNLYLFGEEWGRVEFDECDVYGACPAGSPDYEALQPDPSRKNIVLLHGALRTGGRAAPGEIVLSRLAGKAIDYLALGHYHAYTEGKLDERGRYAYAGCPEGRGFDECGLHGIVLLDTEGDGITSRFLAFAERTLHSVTVDVTGAKGMRDIELAARRALSGIPATDMAELILRGNLPGDFCRNIPFLQELLSGLYFFASVKDETRLLLDPETWKNDKSLKGEFIRRVLASGLSEEKRDAILEAGLSALRGEVTGL